MPAYEYQCIKCKRIIEHVCKISEKPEFLVCPVCTGTAERIVSDVVIQDDHPLWIDNNLKASIQDDSDKPIETRSDLDAFCKKRGIVENPKSA
jgi:putative FmdB family regulatory protein